MNAAFGFRFDAAFFAISSPCDGAPIGRPELGALYYAHSCTSVPLFSEGKCEKFVLFRGKNDVSRGENVFFREKRRGRSPVRRRLDSALPSGNREAGASSTSARPRGHRRFPQ